MSVNRRLYRNKLYICMLNFKITLNNNFKSNRMYKQFIFLIGFLSTFLVFRHNTKLRVIKALSRVRRGFSYL